MSSVPQIAGQLNETERRLLTEAILQAPRKPETVIEVGTWLGGGSTLHILRALEQNGTGHLWGIEADSSIYTRMVENIHRAAPETSKRFTPIFGFSDQAIPRLLSTQPSDFAVDFVFLDGGNNPMEQITEFRLLDPRMPVGGQLMAHDALMRKGRWLVPYLDRLDNWRMELVEGSEMGLVYARKIAAQPSPASHRAASAHLFRLRCNPVEIAAAVLPSWICGFCLGLLPRRFAKRLSDGCK